MARRLRIGFFLLLVTVSTHISSQSNEMIDAILTEEVATVGSAAYVALAAGGLIDDDASPERAVTVAGEAGWLPEGVDANSPASFGQIAYLLMQSSEVSGGLMYRLIPGPRYAAREFVFRGWSPERRTPGERVSGQFLVRVTGNFLDNTEVSR
ncbi:MAG: hypothetical protein ACOC7V_09545 [Spirochaetota bacterium]